MVLNLNADEKSITSANLICKKEVFKKIEFNSKLYPGEDPRFIEDAKAINKEITTKKYGQFICIGEMQCGNEVDVPVGVSMETMPLQLLFA